MFLLKFYHILWYWISQLPFLLFFPFFQEHLKQIQCKKSWTCCVSFLLFKFCCSNKKHVFAYLLYFSTCTQCSKTLNFKSFDKINYFRSLNKILISASRQKNVKQWVPDPLLFSNNFWFFWVHHQNTFTKA